MGLIAFAVSFGVAIYYYFLGLFISSVMVSCFSVCTGLILLLQYKRLLGGAQMLILGCICALLIVSSFIEGAATGQYFYFFSVVVVIPVVMDYKKSSNIEVGMTYVVVITSFALCFYFGHTHKPFENIPSVVARQMLFSNAGSAIGLTLLFSIAYIYYERMHLKAIVNEKNNAIAMRTKFLSTMGHELRTPLNGIIGALNIIQDEHPAHTKNEYFPVLKYCSSHMQQLINDILDFNKIEADKLSIHPVEINLKQLLVNSTLPFYNHIEEKQLHLIVEIDPKLDIAVLVDDVRLIQVLNNLLSNAMKFTEKGYIKLVAACTLINNIAVNVAFRVEDSGIGIQKRDQQKIFESFGQVYNESSRKYSGTGLGLTICLRLLRLMGSELQLESEDQRGSTFSFELQLERPLTVPGKVSQVVADSDDLSGLRLLLVEDNQINMMIAKKMLTGKNAQCGSAYNGQEALDLLAADSNFDMVLLDLEMPVMDGYTAVREIKSRYPHIPVVALTASLVDEHTVAALVASGFEDCILKPFQPQHLFRQIRQYVKESAVGSEQ
jgi:signal transduction histidine kinase